MTGILREVTDDWVSVAVDALEYEVLVPGFVRRHLQGQQGQTVTLYTLHYLEGNPVQGRLVPRLVGFRTDTERAFFELFGTVDGMGYRKALRALDQPVAQVAQAIRDADLASLISMPGVGEAIAERIVAKLRRKVAEFARAPDQAVPTGQIDPDVRRDAISALVGIGHREREAAQMVQAALQGGKEFSTVEDLLSEIYRQHAGK